MGLAAVQLGAGRAKKSDPIDHAVGIVLAAKVGDRVAAGQPLAWIHAADRDRLAAAQSQLLAAYRFSAERVQPLPLIYDVLR